MQTYDFVWQPILGGLPFDRAKFETAIEAAGAVRRPDGAWLWRLSKGETVVTALNDAGLVVGFDVRVPVSDSAELVIETLVRSASLAAAMTLQLVDPQLSRAVTDRDAASVEDSYIRVAKYAGAYIEGTAPAWTAAAAEASAGLSFSTKVLLAVVVFLSTMFFAYQMVAT